MHQKYEYFKIWNLKKKNHFDGIFTKCSKELRAKVVILKWCEIVGNKKVNKGFCCLTFMFVKTCERWLSWVGFLHSSQIGHSAQNFVHFSSFNGYFCKHSVSFISQFLHISSFISKGNCFSQSFWFKF